MANGFGLYDMAGNAWEWTWDRMGNYAAYTWYGYDPADRTPAAPNASNAVAPGGTTLIKPTTSNACPSLPTAATTTA